MLSAVQRLGGFYSSGRVAQHLFYLQSMSPIESLVILSTATPHAHSRNISVLSFRDISRVVLGLCRVFGGRSLALTEYRWSPWHVHRGRRRPV